MGILVYNFEDIFFFTNMPKRNDIKSILIIGAGPIVIGQACEFDYSGTQGIKALKEEGYRVILINSNPATIMTDSELADAVYIEPITPSFVEQVIAKEQPDAILPTLGGQTALNMALDLNKMGVLQKYNVKLIGASVEAIEKAEDRGLFKQAMTEIGLRCPASFICTNIVDAMDKLLYWCYQNGGYKMGSADLVHEEDSEITRNLMLRYYASSIDFNEGGYSLGKKPADKTVRQKCDDVIRKIEKGIQSGIHTELAGLPAVIRPSLTLGGTGGGVANTVEEYIGLVNSGLEASPITQIQIDQSLIGWKEFEMEVIRDKNDNGIIVCCVENIDPMGVHTGDSITVAPSMTLTDKEYQVMRDASLAVLRKVGVETGGSNVQFTINPNIPMGENPYDMLTNGHMLVIEMNPRVSRSSALVSKATGFPIAKVAAKLAVGYTLDEIKNDIACTIPKEFDYLTFKVALEFYTNQNTLEGQLEKCKQFCAERGIDSMFIISGNNVKTLNENAINHTVFKFFLNNINDIEKAKGNIRSAFNYIDTQIQSGLALDAVAQQILPASFEPAIDYTVIKIPKFNFEKFGIEKPELGTQMQSVGEVMAIGRCFEEALNKAIVSLEGVKRYYLDVPLEDRLKLRSPTRILDIIDYCRDYIVSYDKCDPKFIAKIATLSGYDKWFVNKLASIAQNRVKISKISALNKEVSDASSVFKLLDHDAVLNLKIKGFGDLEIRETLGVEAGRPGTHLFREYRKECGIVPVFKKIDTCAGEFNVKTNYFYSTYEHGSTKLNQSNTFDIIHPHNEAKANAKRKVIIIGSGPNRIGQGIEFDYTCVHGLAALREIGIESIMINCNPETVSTDFDSSDRLYFEPITNEHVLNILENEMDYELIGLVSDGISEYHFNTLLQLTQAARKFDKYKFTLELEVDNVNAMAGSKRKFASKLEFIDFLENYIGVIIQFGGQTPLKLRDTLYEYAIPILGMGVDAINICDDRGKFDKLCKELKAVRPTSSYCETFENLQETAKILNYNFLIRPSGVIGGRGMRIINNKEEFDEYLRYEGNLKEVLVDEFLSGAIEFDVDAIRDKSGNTYICGVLEHIEYAGVHSGDSACTLPVRTISSDVQEKIENIVFNFADKLKVVGLINVQVAMKGGQIYIIEVNPRASRTVPFICKAVNIPLAKIATKVMCGQSLEEIAEFTNFQKKERVKADLLGLKHYWRLINPKIFAVKEAMFSFEKFLNSDIILGPEMKSTGEVMGIARTFEKAYTKAIMATKQKFCTKGNAFISIKNADKTDQAVEIARQLFDCGFRILCTSGTAKFLRDNHIICQDVKKVSEAFGDEQSILDMIKQDMIDVVINTTASPGSLQDSLSIRRAILSKRILYSTNLEAASVLADSIAAFGVEILRTSQY